MTLLRPVILGADGFVGRAILSAAVGAIRVPRVHFETSVEGRGDPLADATGWIRRNGTDYANLVSSIRDSSGVINAIGVADRGRDDWRRLYAGNVLAPLVLAHACAEADRTYMLHVSSYAVQGLRVVLDESNVMEPRSLYGCSKALAETALTAFADDAGLNLGILRPASVMGSGRAQTAIVARRLAGPVPTSRASTTLPLVHIQTVASAAVGALDKKLSGIVGVPDSGLTLQEVVGALGGTTINVPYLDRVARWALDAPVRLPSMLADHLKRLHLLLSGQRVLATRLIETGWRSPVEPHAVIDLLRAQLPN